MRPGKYERQQVSFKKISTAVIKKRNLVAQRYAKTGYH